MQFWRFAACYCVLVACWCVTSLVAQDDNSLQFRQGVFKIAQFTDIHYVSTNPISTVSVELIAHVLDAERPDFVVFTGDIVVSGDVFAGWDAVLAPVVERKVSWGVTFGNHDDEAGKTRREVLEHLESKPYGILGKEQTRGVGDIAVRVLASDAATPSLVLYLLDSQAYSRIKGVDGYGWFAAEQIQWYRQRSASLAQQNKGKPVPALAFFHIPLVEYTLLSREKLIGERQENECPGAVNSGMFAAMLESGDVMGTFVGHEHDNDYIGLHHGIALAYGRFSGTKTTYTKLPHGARVIEVSEGNRGFKTWVRLRNDEVIHVAEYPQSWEKSATPTK